MPRVIEEGFRDFHSKLTATATETAITKKHRSSISACLEKNYSMYSFFRSGSFGNGTNISGYSDVDYFAVIPAEKLNDSSNYTLLKIKKTLSNRFPNTGVCVRTPTIKVPFGKYRSEDYYYQKDNLLMQPFYGYPVYSVTRNQCHPESRFIGTKDLKLQDLFNNNKFVVIDSSFTKKR